MTEEERRRPFWDEGAHAYRRRLGRATCPYVGWQREAWLGGWLDAWGQGDEPPLPEPPWQIGR